MKKILLILSIIFLFISMFFLKHYATVFFFQNDRYKIAVNIEVSEENKDNDMYICFNKNCDKMQFKNNMYSYKLNQENPLFYYDNSGEAEIITQNKDFINKIKSISIFSKDFKYLKNFTQKTVEFQDKDAYSIKIADLNNEKSIIKKASIYFESLFYNWYFYIITYILLLIYFIKYKPKFEFLYKNQIPIILILFLGLFLRLSHINFIPFWNDELYTMYFISEGKFNFLKTFSDPGNPPLFFIISNIWLMFFNKTMLEVRLLPCLIGVFNIYSIYYILDKILNRKSALLGAFLTAINIFIILESTEIRSYILSTTLVLWGVYFFLKLYKDFSNKNLIFYTVISILLINLHYYTILFVVFNFILGIFLFKFNKKFIFLNILSFLTVIPFLANIIKISLSTEFNTWLEKPTLSVLANHITFYFGNIIFFIITAAFSCFVIKKLLSIKEKKIVLYNISAIAFVFIFSYLFSILVKPILFEKYFCIFLPLMITNTVVFINADYNLKYKPIIVFLIFLFSINMPKYENFNLFSNINEPMNYFMKDGSNIENSYYVVPDRIEYINHFKEIDKTRAIVSNLGVREDKDLLEIYKKSIKNQKNTILYIPEICINSKIKYSKNENIKVIQTTTVPIYKVLLE